MAHEPGVSVSATQLQHRVTCFCFVIQEAEAPGSLDIHKCVGLGVPKGPLLGQLKAGKDVTLADGRVVKSTDVVGAPIQGRKVVILGDTSDSRNMKPLAMDCDVLVHEATHEDRLRDKAIDCGHSTPAMAAQFAMEVRAKCLILTHFSARYKLLSETNPKVFFSFMLRVTSPNYFIHTTVSVSVDFQYLGHSQPL